MAEKRKMGCNTCPICKKPKPCYDEICYQCELKGLSKKDDKLD